MREMTDYLVLADAQMLADLVEWPVHQWEAMLEIVQQAHFDVAVTIHQNPVLPARWVKKMPLGDAAGSSTRGFSVAVS